MIPWTAIAMLGSAGLGALTGRSNKTPVEQRQLMTAQKGLTESQTRGSDIENMLNQLLLSRKQAQDPFWRAMQTFAFNRLPLYAQQGFNMDTMANPVGVIPTPTKPGRPLSSDGAPERTPWRA